jgi:hypothetical protein
MPLSTPQILKQMPHAACRMPHIACRVFKAEKRQIPDLNSRLAVIADMRLIIRKYTYEWGRKTHQVRAGSVQYLTMYSIVALHLVAL